MIPLTLVTGFLGSGKTTFLQAIVDRHHDRKIAYLINEFSSVDVDGRRIEPETGKVVSVAGGSIFCRCLVTSFISQLQEIADTFDTPDAPLEGLIIEASGIADPRIVATMLAETKLDERYELRRVISVIDPGSFPKLLETLPNITAQVEASSLAIINKTDLFEDDVLDDVEQKVRAINPAVRIHRAEFCRVEFDLFGEGPANAMQGDYAKCVDPNYAHATLLLDKPVEVDQILPALQALGPQVYRVKGFLPVGTDTLYVDYSASGLRTELVGRRSDQAELAFIYPPASQPAVDEVLTQFRS